MSSSSCFEAGQKAGNRILRRPTSALTVALLGAALSACNDGSTNATKPAALVRTETVQLRDRQASVTLTGEVQARFRADLSFRVSGRVTERFVDVGAHVDAGEVLARLDPAEQQADLDAATAAEAAAKSQLRVAQANFDRQKTLLANRFTTQVAFDQAQEALRSAESTREAAQAQLGTAKDALGYTELRAGAAGVITTRSLEVGQVVQAAQPVFTLAQDGDRDAVFDVYESIFFGDFSGDKISLALVANPSVTATGSVREVSPAIDPKSSTVRVKVAIQNPPAAMTLGSAVAGTARAKPVAQITVPWTALMSSGSKPAVWIVDPATKTASLKTVDIGSYEAGAVLIKGGLVPGERVVVDGGKLLSSGQPVTEEGGGLMMRAIVIASMFVFALFTAGCKPETEAQEPVRPVLSTVVEPTAPGSTAAVGSVEPRYKTDLSFRVLGRLIARPVNVGDSVEQGEIVGAIDSTALELAVRSAKAELSRSQAQLANASATEQRQRTLIATDTTSRETLDNAVQVRAGAEASVARAQANLTKAIEQLGHAQVKADFAGIVTAVAADVGQVVSPGQTVVTVARPDIREAVVDIGPDFPVPLRVGLPFTVSLQLLPAIQVGGQIREIAPQADPVTRTQRVRIALNDPPSSFRLGATVTARLASDQRSILRVPESAVLSKDGENFVWVVDLPASTVSLRKVDAFRDDGGIQVTGGLEAGTRIATAGIHSLTQGQHVRIDQD